MLKVLTFHLFTDNQQVMNILCFVYILSVFFLSICLPMSHLDKNEQIVYTDA